MLGSSLCRFYSVLVLLGGAGALFATITKIPAFDPETRLTAVDGSWFVADRSAHYDRGQYLHHLGFAYLNAPEFSFDGVDGSMVLLEPEELIARTEQAETLLSQSVTFDPANGYVWAARAQAQVSLGKFDEMRASLLRSWELAPHSRQLAAFRLRLLADLLELSPDGSGKLDAQALQFAQTDSETLRLFEPDELAGIFSLSPETERFLTQ